MPTNRSASIRVASIDAVDDHGRSQRQDYVVVEEPLAVKLSAARDGSRTESDLAITMRTPGHDEELAAGLVLSEGIVRERSGIRNVFTRRSGNREHNEVVVELAVGVEGDTERMARNMYMSSSCGVCGKTSMEALRAAGCERLADGPEVSREVIHRLPGMERDAQITFERTGALHAAALFDCEGALLSVREDVGRHNALDKLIGSEFLAERAMDQRIVLLSGRTGFELVQKCVMARIPILASVGAPSSLAVETALRFNVTLLGFVRDGRFNIYTGTERIT